MTIAVTKGGYTLRDMALALSFRQGLNDRLAGRPIVAFGDKRDSSGAHIDAYLLGYDPYNQLGMRSSNSIRWDLDDKKITFFCEIAEVDVPSVSDLPLNRCEFR